MKKYLIDDAEYFVRGRGVGPMMVFAHGFPFDGAIFDDVVERLSEKFYCVVPDLRGFGASTLGANGRNPSGFPRVTMGRYADDLTILSSVVACERRMDPQATKIFICGLSMGGFHSHHISKQYPDMFDYVGL
ncbi:MAG: alpha/beta fold hydrolase, partial [Oscillospiraceae bacterium]|nr:alpha/beta fold hydrolase [Oscillospiraceae bacterium]